MIHEKSGIEIDFAVGDNEYESKYICEDLLEGVSTEELIRGTVLEKTYTYQNDEGGVDRVEICSMHTNELIDQRNGVGIYFMDELSSINVSKEGLAKVRAGASASTSLTEEEIKEIRDLVEEHLILCFCYSDKECLFDPCDI